jgi:hypothetical protein
MSEDNNLTAIIEKVNAFGSMRTLWLAAPEYAWIPSGLTTADLKQLTAHLDRLTTERESADNAAATIGRENQRLADRLDEAQQYIIRLTQERDTLMATVKAFEVHERGKMIWKKDHEFPWVEVNMATREMRCECGATGTTNSWLDFLSRHEKCGTSIAQIKAEIEEKGK